jgi:hypothetical protein
MLGCNQHAKETALKPAAREKTLLTDDPAGANDPVLKDQHRMRFDLLALVVWLPVVACTTTPLSVPDTPAPLRAPAGQSVYLEARATGVQVYECSQKSDSSYEWTFVAPEASLATPAGQPLGKHYAGPTWESVDGSTVVGEVRGRDPGPTPSAIPWLLLSAKNNGGSGVFSTTRSIQRLATNGGIAPSTPCNAANLRQVARVPYTATYYFYR